MRLFGKKLDSTSLLIAAACSCQQRTRWMGKDNFFLGLRRDLSSSFGSFCCSPGAKHNGGKRVISSLTCVVKGLLVGVVTIGSSVQDFNIH